MNIAEGSGRTSKKDRRNFYIMARSSALECGSITGFLHAENEITSEERLELYQGFDELSRILFTMIRNLEGDS